MTLADLERLLESQAPGALVPRDWVLEQIRAVSVGDVGDELADLSVQEAGRVLGRSASTVRDYCRRKLLPGAYRQRGREWRVPRVAIRRFQEAQASAHRPKAAPRARPSEAVDLGDWRKEFEGQAA